MSIVWVPNKWAVAVEGDEQDLQDAAELFAVGKVTVRRGVVTSGDAVLLAEEIELLQSVEEVRDAAERMINVVNGILFLEEPARTPLRVVGIHERNATGGWGVAVICGSADAMIRGVKSKGMAGVAPPIPSPQSAWMLKGLEDDVVEDVLVYLRGRPDWFNLYKAYETMESDFGKHSSQQQSTIKWPDRSLRSQFRQDAQLYRHSRSWWNRKRIPNTSPMTLREASTFIRTMARGWLEWRCARVEQGTGR